MTAFRDFLSREKEQLKLKRQALAKVDVEWRKADLRTFSRDGVSPYSRKCSVQ
jgi:hypothetical protein